MIFGFPSSPNDELQFRDGKRVVPEYLAVMLASIETELFTYDEAVALANQNMLGQHIGSAANSMIVNHFRGRGVRDGNR